MIFNDESLTYEELNAKANQSAYYIRNQYKKTKKRLKSNVSIALCLDRSLSILIGILAVLKAGGALCAYRSKISGRTYSIYTYRYQCRFIIDGVLLKKVTRKDSIQARAANDCH